MNRQVFVLLVLTLALPRLALPQAPREIDERIAASPRTRVEIDNEIGHGTLQVKGSRRDHVLVEGSMSPSLKLELSGDAEEIRIEIDEDHSDGRRGHAGHASVELTIHVPEDASLAIESLAANVKVEQVMGAVEAETLEASLVVRSPASRVEAATVSGSIEVEVTGGFVEAASVSGPVTVRGAGGRVRLESVSGPVRLEAEGLEDGEVESVSGAIEVEASLATGGSLEVECLSGEVDIRLPRDVSASFQVETFSGRIVNELGPEARATTPGGLHRELGFVTGSGDARVEVESFSGNVRLRTR